MENLLTRYRRQDRVLKIGAIAVLLVLIGLIVAPRPSIGPAERSNPQVALFQPQRSEGEVYLKRAALRLHAQRLKERQGG